MNIEQVRDFVLSLYGVTEDQPFGDDNITFRVEGKIFLCLWLANDKQGARDSMLRFACKLAPERNEMLREQHFVPNWRKKRMVIIVINTCIAISAMSRNKKHWSDIYYEQLEPEQVMAWIVESYELIVSKLPKAMRANFL